VLFSVGDTVGPYRIIEQLGQGGMVTVYKAYHAALDRYVVLKVLHPAFLEKQNFLARFQREVRLLQTDFNAKQGQTDSGRNLLTALWDD
jgi:serine/threonine protein kinase